MCAFALSICCSYVLEYRFGNNLVYFLMLKPFVFPGFAYSIFLLWNSSDKWDKGHGE